MQKLAMAIVGILILCSCQSITTKNWSSDDLIIDDQASLAPPAKLSKLQSKEDIDFLIYALTRGYGGRRYLPGKSFENAIEALSRLSGVTNLELFRDGIDEALLTIPDDHLMARLNGHPSRKRLLSEKVGTVGKNNIRDQSRVWEVRIDRLGKRKILFISITKFPPRADKVWDEFLSSINRKLKASDAVVIDMRGNGGGDDTIGMELAKLLFGREFEYPVQRQYVSQTPETFAIAINRYTLRSIRLRNKGNEVPGYFSDLLREPSEKYILAKQGKLPAEFIRTDKGAGKRTDPILGFKKSIFILMDGECGSSCESTIAAFEWNPYVIRVGENTAGCTHFGNIGYILLPHSKVEVQVPTQYSEYFDHRFIEKIGIKPDMKVPSGQDAYDAVKLKIGVF